MATEHIEVFVTYDDDSMRKFIAPGTIQPKELANSLVKAYVLLEECEIGWAGADDICAITELLRHCLERYGFREEVLEQ